MNDKKSLSAFVLMGFLAAIVFLLNVESALECLFLCFI